MSEPFRQPLDEALEFLLRLHRDGIPPREALSRLRALQERHPAVELDLVWSEERLARAVDYQALLYRPCDGTLSLGFAPERAVPWPLRGAIHAREEAVVRVDQWQLTVADVMTFLDFIWKDTALIRQLVDQALIALETARRGLQPTDEQLQRAMDLFRRRHGLTTAALTAKWLEERGFTQVALEQTLADGLRGELLRDEIVGERAEAYFAEHRREFDTAVIVRFTVPDEAAAQRLHQQIASGTLPFIQAAQEAFLARSSQPASPTFTRLRRSDLPPDQTGRLFSAQPGAVLPPAPRGGGYELVQVLAQEPARLDEETCERIRDRIFAEWLDARRASADIEWFWGGLPRTRGV